MAERIVIVGGGGHAKVIVSLLQGVGGLEVAGYVDKVDLGPLLGVPYLGDDSALVQLASKHRNAAIGIGSVTDPAPRRSLFERCKEAGMSLPHLVAASAAVGLDVQIGEGTVVMEGAVVQAGARIGVGAIVNSGAIVDHDCVIGDFAHVAPGAALSGGVRLGNDAHVGTGASVIQGIKIGEGCVIGAGAAVLHDCEAGGTYVGVPARMLPRG